MLTNAFRSILQDLDVNPYLYNSLMEQYLHKEVSILEKKRRDREARRKPNGDEKPLNHAELNRRDRTTTRGNLNKEFGRDTMTWKVFCKALAFLQVRRFRLILVVERSNGMVTEHTTPMVTLDPEAMIIENLEESAPKEMTQQAQPLNVVSPPLTMTKSRVTIHENPTNPEGQ